MRPDENLPEYSQVKRGAPSGFVDEEEQQDIENAREEVAVRKELIRNRIIFRAIGPAERDKTSW